MMKWGDEVRLGQSLDGRDEGRNEVMGFKIARTTGSGHCLAGCGGRQMR